MVTHIIFAAVLSALLRLGSAHEVTLSPTIGIDLETGYTQAATISSGIAYDLVFSCGPDGTEFLRALGSTAWTPSPNTDFSVGYEVLKGASYASPAHASGYPDIFHTWKNLVPAVGTIYLIRTTEGNLAKVRIAGYHSVSPNPYVCRSLSLEYVLYRGTS